ncbi:hypothetical protein DSO57_1004629 [Entomophthora muscae]|uniref:Uncharacterized protein n=1 Tax=Entomophthora muscae TaxID=34485 RepID=A0ACC2SL45_9FUNG|nr:hypothetical protein DSO57_1004629 [Entomophthora muscae]
MLSTLIKYSVLGLVGYLSLVAIIVQPPIQKSLIYLNWVNYPFPSKLETPSKLGFSKGEVRNFRFDTPDGVTLGAWQFLPNSIHKEAYLNRGKESNFGDEFYSSQLQNSKNDVVLYLHGNAANRGSHVRYSTYESITLGLNSHLIVIDYRGFGDSTGTPSEYGLFQDSLAAWNWLMDQGVDASRITILGHSLGTGVSSRLVSHLNSINVYPKAMILTAPYSSIGRVLFDFRLFHFFPLFSPLKFIPDHEKHALKYLEHRFDTNALIPTLQTPFILFHGVNDAQIPSTHSWCLFNSSLDSFGKTREDFTSSTLPRATGNVHLYSSQGSKPSFIKFVEIHKATHNDLADYPEFSQEIASFWDLVSK